MIIVLGSQKGGVGKSTLAVSIAAYLMSLGNRVIIVDADDQKSVLTWYNNRPEDLPHIPVTGATGNIKAMLKEHEKSYDFVIADCAGRDSAEMRSGLMAADVFISALVQRKLLISSVLPAPRFIKFLKTKGPRDTPIFIG